MPKITRRFQARRFAPAVLLSALGATGLAVFEAATSAPARGAAKAPATAPPPKPVVESRPVGLDSLSEQTVISELADRGLTSLLNRAFEVNKIAPADREGFAALRALRELADTSKPLDNARRITLVRQAVGGLNAVQSKIDKVEDLMGYTASLIERGIEPDINTLEYWGENPVTQKQVKPTAETAMKMLDRVVEEVRSEQGQIERVMKSPNDPAGVRWLKLDGLADNSVFVKNMVAYYRALATDATTPAGIAERKKVADDAIEYYKGFDNADSNVQPLVHVRIGKLNWVKGDFAAARKILGEVAAKKVGDKPMVPEPALGQIFEARFFLVLTAISDKKPDEAAKTLEELREWVSSNIPKTDQSAVSAAVQLCNFRLTSLRADLATDAAEKRKFDQQASELLTKLSEEHPEYRTIITEQLVNRLPEDADLAKQSVPVLQALMNKGDVERGKPEKEPVDTKILKRAADAAMEISSRKTGVPPRSVQDAMLRRAIFLDRLKDDVAAGNAFVDFADRYGAIAKDIATQAVQRAVTIAFELRKTERDEPAVKQLFGRALAVAAGQDKPFKIKPLYYHYANYLRQMNQNQAAADYYRAVPKGDPNEFNARFFGVIAMYSQLEDTKLPDAARKKIEAEMSTTIDQVRSVGQAIKPQNDATRIRLAITTELGADLAQRQGNPKRALELLEGYDDSLKGLPNELALQKEARQVRINAYLATNKINEALAQVKELAGGKDADSTAPFVRVVLERLSRDRDLAKVQGKAEEVARISGSQAELTGYLVKWATESNDPNIKKLAPQYRIYDANVKRQAGVEQSDPKEKKRFLDDALAAYQSIRDAMKAQGTVDPATDSTVSLGLGLCEYDLGDYKAAHQDLGKLIVQMKLGGPVLHDVDPKTGEPRDKDNEAYWEAMYKWLRCKVELSKANSSDPDSPKLLETSKSTLRDLFVTNASRTGGDKWSAQFDELRKELIPEWTPGSKAPMPAPMETPASPLPAATTTPATEPAP